MLVQIGHYLVEGLRNEAPIERRAKPEDRSAKARKRPDDRQLVRSESAMPTSTATRPVAANGTGEVLNADAVRALELDRPGANSRTMARAGRTLQRPQVAMASFVPLTSGATCCGTRNEPNAHR